MIFARRIVANRQGYSIREGFMAMKYLVSVIVLLLSIALTPARAAPIDDLNMVIADHWKWWLIDNPVEANAMGVRDSGRTLPDISLATRDRRADDARAFRKRLATIADRDLTPEAHTNKAILARLLDEQVEANGFGQRMMLFTTYDSFFQSFAGIGERIPFDRVQDFRAYLDRLAAFPKMNREAIAITRQALVKGYVQPCEALGGFEETISGAVAGAPEQTRFYAPFARTKPTFVPQDQWDALKVRATTTIRETIVPEYRAFAAFYAKEYQPRCRTSIGASAMPEGPAYYAAQVRRHTTTDLTPDAIHQIGLSEVARILTRMDGVAKGAGYASRTVMVAEMRTNPKYYARSPEDLLAAAARMAKAIDGQMPLYFGKLPRLPYGIKEIPKEIAETTTTAYYSPGSPQAGLAGNYYVNTSKLDQRPLFELPALSAHEAVPGHHHQIALQQELDQPDFRKHIVGFTAYVEGWGLYSEYLGEEMGLYDTPEKMMGRLSYEMWRACRLVVDTGMHAKGWSKAQAIAFMRDNSALSAANIEAEVNRYISWPGQALGYKLGEIKIRELRAKAEAALGPKFNLRRFHDSVLAQGPVPLDTLEAQMAEWIASEKAR
jgi:uncharacterized protein (DUF885 family)